MTKNTMDPRSLTHIAARPAAFVKAPEILTCKIFSTSVVTLAKKRLANKANIVKTAKGTSPKETEATDMLEQMKMLIISGQPTKFANMEASVCSAQVMGNQ
jgi:hypothetical protein